MGHDVEAGMILNGKAGELPFQIRPVDETREADAILEVFIESELLRKSCCLCKESTLSSSRMAILAPVPS